jgi:predicted nuclease with RNAse H fold
MLFAEAVYVGIDPTAGQRPMQYAALDSKRQIISLDQGDMESVLAFVTGLEAAVVAIASPQAPNTGLMKQPVVRRRLNLSPRGRTWRQWRLGEYELRRRNVRLYNTPDTIETAPRWVQNGFKMFLRLRDVGYRHFESGKEIAPRTLLEVIPHASFALLLERRPFLKRTLEGRMQRQLILYLEGLDLINPMKCLEEVTRHHLLTGHLPLEGLYQPDQLDALVAAYTAYLTGLEPARVSQVGDREEGLISLPVNELKDFYP